MNQIKITPFSEQPDPSTEDFICAFPEFILGHLFDSANEITTRESDPDVVEWRSEHGMLAKTKVGVFRALLARFGYHFLGGQFYGGSATLALQRGGAEICVRIDMANSQREGFSLRAIRTPAPTTDRQATESPSPAT